MYSLLLVCVHFFELTNTYSCVQEPRSRYRMFHHPRNLWCCPFIARPPSPITGNHQSVLHPYSFSFSRMSNKQNQTACSFLSLASSIQHKVPQPFLFIIVSLQGAFFDTFFPNPSHEILNHRCTVHYAFAWGYVRVHMCACIHTGIHHVASFRHVRTRALPLRPGGSSWRLLSRLRWFWSPC